jgi:RNA polymerase sigma-70 factor (ECF subfamily)
LCDLIVLETVLDYSQLDDGVLIQLIMGGQASSLNELYSRYSRFVYSIALHIAREQAEADEITLAVFTKVWEKADTYRPDQGSVRVWLISLARKRAIDTLRRDNVHAKGQRNIGAETAVESKSFARMPAADANLSSRKERLRSAINQLTEDQRDVLALAYFQGYTQREIAQLRNLPLGIVKTRIRSGIRKLRQILQEKDDHLD